MRPGRARAAFHARASVVLGPERKLAIALCCCLRREVSWTRAWARSFVVRSYAMDVTEELQPFKAEMARGADFIISLAPQQFFVNYGSEEIVVVDGRPPYRRSTSGAARDCRRFE